MKTHVSPSTETAQLVDSTVRGQMINELTAPTSNLTQAGKAPRPRILARREARWGRRSFH